MDSAVTVGKRTISRDELLPLLSGYDLWPKLMEGIVLDRLLRFFDCSFQELEEYYRLQVAADPEFFEKRKLQMKEQGVGADDLDFFLKRPVLLEKFKQDKFLPHAERAFLDMKAGLDRVVFCMIRNRDHELLRELFFRLESGEESFENLAPKYSEGREAFSRGQIGPVELRLLNPALARVLATGRQGEIKQPVVIDGYGVITQVVEKIPARLNDAMRQKITGLLFEEWLKKEVETFFY